MSHFLGKVFGFGLVWVPQSFRFSTSTPQLPTSCLFVLVVLSEVIQVSVGCTLHFDIKFSLLDYSIHQLTLSSTTDAAKASLCRRLVEARECDLGIFLRHFRRRFPEPSDMQSPLALGVLRSRELLKKFHTIRSERGHARQRQDLSSSGHGKRFMHHARRDMMSQARCQHIECHGRDPALRLPRSGGQPLVPIAQDAFEHFIPKDLVAQLNDISSPPIGAGDILRVPLKLPAAPGGILPLPPIPAAAAAEVPPAAGALAIAPQPQQQGGPMLSGRGGSVYQTIARSKFAAARLLVGTRKLTREEIAGIYSEAGEERRCAEAEGGARWQRWVELYNEEVKDRKMRQKGLAKASATGGSVLAASSGGAAPSAVAGPAYKPHFHCMGTPDFPISPYVLMQADPPKDEYVYKDKKYIIFPEDVIYPLRGGEGLNKCTGCSLTPPTE